MQPLQHTLPTPYPVGPVHCYSAEINGELLLIDTGPPMEEGKKYLQQHFDLQRLQHVLITHCHIDHYGLAAWLEREYDCTIYLPYRDSLKIANHSKRLDGLTAIRQEIGFSAAFAEAFRCEMDSDLVFPEFPQQFKIAEQELPPELGIEILACPGHSQSDLVYVGSNWAATGDTMLREIFQSPMLDIDLKTGKRFHNYAAYCDTILKLATLRDKQILPGHNGYIIGVDFNISYYTDKLLKRAKQSRKFSAELNAPEVVEKLFGDSIQEPFQNI
ncbi:MBL fold metallo-hydrolase [Malonomonas rubra]|uniref:MBL fold metallo-hydrolase n=1 Tax=Malonomonas rubra TaxID=57040 RepID=UPI0026EBEBB0|nr:MBL fold metallo-hydrolase [Malonomonas rubra]